MVLYKQKLLEKTDWTKTFMNFFKSDPVKKQIEKLHNIFYEKKYKNEIEEFERKEKILHNVFYEENNLFYEEKYKNEIEKLARKEKINNYENLFPTKYGYKQKYFKDKYEISLYLLNLIYYVTFNRKDINNKINIKDMRSYFFVFIFSVLNNFLKKGAKFLLTDVFKVENKILLDMLKNSISFFIKNYFIDNLIKSTFEKLNLNKNKKIDKMFEDSASLLFDVGEYFNKRLESFEIENNFIKKELI